MAHYAVIICPHCGFSQEEIMLTHAQTVQYTCNGCKVVLKPEEGGCCVFCSYGTADCPTGQHDKKCCVPKQA